MHLLLPFASTGSEAGARAVQTLNLPQLERLLARLSPTACSAADALSLNLPHEHVLAACRGWDAGDGRLPLAAWLAGADGLPVTPGQGWGLLTPTHWEVGSEQVVLLDPARLQLHEDESRALWQSLHGLFEGEGWVLHWGAPLRWYATHASLSELASASLERVVGHGIDQWLPDRSTGRTLRRLQSEAQMLLYTHPVNAAREQRGALAVNSFWLSGCGMAQPGQDDAGLCEDDRLRAPALAQDWAAWAEAWQALDRGPVADLLQRLGGGEAVALTLCGERVAQRFEPVAGGGVFTRLARRFRRPDVAALLEAL